MSAIVVMGIGYFFHLIIAGGASMYLLCFRWFGFSFGKIGYKGIAENRILELPWVLPLPVILPKNVLAASELDYHFPNYLHPTNYEICPAVCLLSV